MPELKKGYQGSEYYPWYDWAKKNFASYSFLLGNRDGYFGAQEDAFVREMQRRLNASGIPVVVDGIFGDRMASITRYKWSGQSSSPTVEKRRKIWIYTFPGSGANWDQGPSFILGNMCRDILKLNHQPVYFQKGGYLGFLGGDSKFSYDEVIWDQCKSLEALLDMNADFQEGLVVARKYIADKGWVEEDLNNAQLLEVAAHVENEFHLSGYSQSADGAEEAAEYLFGDPGYIHPGDKEQKPSTGKYRIMRHCLKRVVQFGNPSTKDTGIARKTRSGWLDRKIRNINKINDFYAVVPKSDKIRPRFYAIIVKAEMELPFGVQVLRIAIPVILSWMPIVSMFGPIGQMAAASLAGIDPNGPILSKFIGEAGGPKDQKVTEDLIELLAPTGIMTNIPGMIGLVAALPGLQAHGEYFQPDIDAAYAHIADFRRGKE